MLDKRIRRIQESDTEQVVGLVYELADYEKEPLSCHLTKDQLQSALFGRHPSLFGHVAEQNGEVVGCALWFLNFSTWRGSHGIYLEDLYVSPEHRGSGLGKALLAALAKECLRNGYHRLEWSVLNWNPATEFYKSLGGEPMDGWTVYRLTDEPLTKLATSADAQI